MRSQARRITVETKPFYASKTLWLNAIGFVLGLLSLTEFMAIIPKDWTPYILALTAALNFALRYFTVQAPIGVGAERAARRP